MKNIKAKGGSVAAGKEESKSPVKEEYKKSDKDGEEIDFFYILAGGGVLIGVILIVFGILRYVFHVL